MIKKSLDLLIVTETKTSHLQNNNSYYLVAYLHCTRQYSKHFSFLTNNSQLYYVAKTIIVPIAKELEAQRYSYLPRITQLVSSRAEMQT